MTRSEFAALHRADAPLVLYNIWDAGSAKGVANAGASAIATGSSALAGALGYEDGEALPFAQLLQAVRQIAGVSDLPLTVDFEAGYADSLQDLSDNAAALKAAGAIGCNLEDRLIHTPGLREPAEQAQRIAAVHAAGLFVNARTDTFLAPLMAGEDPNREPLVEAAIARGHTYAEAGAGSFFIPALTNAEMIAQICAALPIPVNVMRLPGMVSNTDLAKLGVARISYGPGPWNEAMAAVEASAKAAFAD